VLFGTYAAIGDWRGEELGSWGSAGAIVWLDCWTRKGLCSDNWSAWIGICTLERQVAYGREPLELGNAEGLCCVGEKHGAGIFGRTDGPTPFCVCVATGVFSLLDCAGWG
jgi:hypothetical protein